MVVDGWTIGIGSTLIGGLVLAIPGWIFRHRLRQAISSLDMSTGAVLAWVLVFIMAAVVIVFPLIGVETPSIIPLLLVMVVVFLMMSTVSNKR